MRARFTGARFRDFDWDQIVYSPDGPVARELDRRADRVQAAARQLVGKRTGTLLATIRKQPQYRIGAVDIVAGHERRTPYLGYHHFGTGPHVILPSRRKALRFVTGGRVVFATRVNHPGSRGTHFLTRALDAARD